MRRSTIRVAMISAAMAACHLAAATAGQAAAMLPGAGIPCATSESAPVIPIAVSDATLREAQKAPRLGGFHIVLVPDAGLSANAAALAAFQRAAAQWEAYFTDPITVTINAGLANLGPSVIGSTGAVQLAVSYASFRAAAVADAADETDDGIVASLPTPARMVPVLPPGFTWNSNVTLSKANLKALGASGLDTTYGASDGTITFNSTFAFDYDKSNGVGAGLTDFETVAAHEIGHLLGFFSNIDTLDAITHAGTGGGPQYLSALDAFRFRSDAGNNPSSGGQFATFVRSLTYNTPDNTDDIDHEWAMSTGVYNGDGRQASHWKDNALSGTLIGIMDPTYSSPSALVVAAPDVRALDLVGYDFDLCGNGTLDPGEGCDDGNKTAGDCCSVLCQFESNGSSCASDANVCTNDVCNGAGACTHPNNTASCNDGLFCNGADTCGGGSCSGHAGNPCSAGGECDNSCNEAADNCQVPFGTACTPDSNACTDDVCSAGACTHPDNTAPCNDGVFCNGADTCSVGSCSQHAGNPCLAGGECNRSCNEGTPGCEAETGPACTSDSNECTEDVCSAGSCTHQAQTGAACSGDSNECTDDVCAAGLCTHQALTGTACTSDSNGCTDDICSAGACAHPGNVAPCDDGLFCNGADTCSGGTCSAHGGDPCAGGAECANACDEAGGTCDVLAATPCTDDGSVCTDDTCDGAGACAHVPNGILDASCEFCPPSPRAGCFAPSRSLVLVAGGAPESARMFWKWMGGEPVTAADFGTPGASTGYALCTYSFDGTTATRLTAALVSNPGGWSATSPKTIYRDKAAAWGGVATIKLLAGPAGRSSLVMKARGPALTLPGPASAGAFFAPGLHYVLQLANSQGRCWGSAFRGDDVVPNTATRARILDALAFCGDGIRDVAEACDGADDTACPGHCDSLTCTCIP